ncbi:MAG TPA: oxidoreductase [Longimicrobiaceae bacterium]|nr:oxidoreductase [Longimicrobiaceae bacterium]
MTQAPRRTAVVLGATGLVGGHCLRLLLEERAYARVHVLTRRTLHQSHPRLVEHVVDFDRLEDRAEALLGEDVFCCLGTTIARAGSQEAFRRVDHDYPLAAARLARKQGARHFLVVTAMGADAGSRIFYNRVKGETEDELRALGYPGLVILRPSLLMGTREEPRRAEEWGKRLSAVIGPLFIGPLAKYRPIQAEVVARAMVRAAERDPRGVRVMESDEIARVGA